MKKKQKREFWADALRTLSIFLVVTIHSSAKIVYQWGSISELHWNFANFINSFARISVPLFVMLSGTFILAKEESLKYFLQKRLPKVILPWLFWGTIQLFYNFNFSLGNIVGSNFASKVAATYFGGFWFVPMILGLYLITPIIKQFTKTAKKNEYIYFFIIWFIFASLIPTLNRSFEVNISYNLPILIKYLGYFVAGYFITHKTKIKVSIIKQIKMLYFISFLLIAIGTYTLSKLNSLFNDSLYDYTNFWVLTTSITGFISLRAILENVQNKISKQLKKIISSISKMSYGIFLSHALILDIFEKYINKFKINSIINNSSIELVFTTLVVFFLSALIITLLNSIKEKIIWRTFGVFYSYFSFIKKNF